MQSLPLSGIRVVSFEHFGAAPYATMLLAALGAEVFKVESADGDFARHTGPAPTVDEKDSLYFQCFNLGKKSIQVNLKDAQDRAFFEDLVRASHAVVNNMRGSLPARLGLDYQSLSAINPAIVCGHISAYGRTNDRADRPGYDFLMQAESGLMALTGEPGNAPIRMGVSMVDHMAGMMLALGVVSAVRGAGITGLGCDIDTSLFDTAVHQLAYQGTWYLNEAIVTSRTPRSAHPSNTPVQLFKTADGWIYLACMTDKFWQLLCKLIARPDLADDPSLATHGQRLARREELTRTLDEVFGTRPTAAWVALLGAEIPAAPVNEIDAALQSDFLLNTAEMVAEIAHPTRSSIRVFATPIRINGKRPPQVAGPKLGEHTEQTRNQLRARVERHA